MLFSNVTMNINVIKFLCENLLKLIVLSCVLCRYIESVIGSLPFCIKGAANCNCNCFENVAIEIVLRCDVLFLFASLTLIPHTPLQTDWWTEPSTITTHYRIYMCTPVRVSINKQEDKHTPLPLTIIKRRNMILKKDEWKTQ